MLPSDQPGAAPGFGPTQWGGANDRGAPPNRRSARLIVDDEPWSAVPIKACFGRWPTRDASKDRFERFHRLNLVFRLAIDIFATNYRWIHPTMQTSDDLA